MSQAQLDQSYSYTASCPSLSCLHQSILVRREDPLEALQIFLDKGADVNSANSHGETALHWATKLLQSYDKKLDVIIALMLAGGDANLSNNDGKTPLQIATDANLDQSIIEVLREGPDMPR